MFAQQSLQRKLCWSRLYGSVCYAARSSRVLRTESLLAMDHTVLSGCCMNVALGAFRPRRAQRPRQLQRRRHDVARVHLRWCKACVPSVTPDRSRPSRTVSWCQIRRCRRSPPPPPWSPHPPPTLRTPAVNYHQIFFSHVCILCTTTTVTATAATAADFCLTAFSHFLL